ncbi:MAG TPA: sugar phosphate isomerase/epimerase family protein [Candidatus Limiplasma sp.]|nr:sugar phosphate isomerase/epimerase family protein [Candidatus Limiplasma sp.]
MNIGIRLHDTIAGTLPRRAAAAAAQGFTCAHVALYKVLDTPPAPADFSPALAATLVRETDPLQIAILGCYLNLAHPDEAEYKQTLAQYLAYLRLSAWVGRCIVGTETGNPNAEYRYDPAFSHTDEALALFIRRLEPVVKEAEALGTTIAIEPVYTHIVHTPQRARYVLDTFASPSLKIILDPVNLLHPDNLDRRDDVIASAIDLLGPDIAAIHLKDYVLENGQMLTVPSGQGVMDDRPVLAYAAHHMPDVPMTLENTAPDNAAAARAHIERVFNEVK